MLGYSALAVCLFVFWRLLRKDIAERDGVSHAVWIPTLWIGILASRPLSMWLHFGGGESSLEGSPLDRLFFFGIILASLIVLMRRRLIWSQVIGSNWAIFLFYAYFLLSVTWAPEPIVSFKRWFKDFGNILVALVLLTEVNPLQAFRATFVRCAYLLLPLSIVFLRYFPELGRRYLRGGQLEVVGVTTQKNSLGILVVICGLALLWDWLERTKPGTPVRGRSERLLPVLFVAIGGYLLFLCDSKTSILCLLFGSAILLSCRLPFFRQRVSAIGFLTILGFGAFFVLDSVFDIKELLLGAMGRDATLTGRTEVWKELLGLKTDPWLGTGFCMIWSDESLLSRLPEWVAKSAHNGYLEVYIDGGYIGVFFLIVMLLNMGLKIKKHLAAGDNYALMRFAVFITLVIGNLSESHWGRMSPMGFMFLLAGIGFAQTAREYQPVRSVVRETQENQEQLRTGMDPAKGFSR